MAEGQSPAEVADAIAEAVRTLNYMTGAGGNVELEYPAELSQVTANLKIAADRLPQLFGQMANWLTDQHTAGRVAHDQGRDAGEYVAAVVEALLRASQDAVTLGAGPRLGARGGQRPKSSRVVRSPAKAHSPHSITYFHYVSLRLVL
jgi:hypothetical protein